MAAVEAAPGDSARTAILCCRGPTPRIDPVEPDFDDVVLIMRALMSIGRDAEMCRAILEDEFEEVEEEDS